MNNRDPAVLDLTFQNFSEDDLEYSDKVFQQLFASAEEDFEYKPLCPIAQARIYNLLVAIVQVKSKIVQKYPSRKTLRFGGLANVMRRI